MTLRKRILLFFIALLLVILLLVLALVQQSTYQHTREQISEQLQFAHGVITNELQARRQAQSALAELIAKDFTLLGEIADLIDSPEQQALSLSAALESFAARSQASFSLVSAPDGRILAGTSAQLLPGQNLPWAALLNDSNPDSHEQLILLEGQVLHVHVTPIFAPRPNLLGWLVMAFVIDDRAAANWAELSGADIAVLAGKPGAYQVAASNLPAAAREQLARTTLSVDEGGLLLELRDQQQVAYSAPLDGAEGQLQLLLLRSLSAELAGYQPLQWQLAAIILAALLLASAGAWFIASSVSRPISQMALSVRRIAAGDYAERIAENAGGEVGLLAREFNHMQKDIAERQATISLLAYSDPLTGLDNRNRFVERMLEALAAATPEAGVAVLLMDLDNFKDLNNTLGHDAGDQLLCLLGERLRQQLRSADSLARLGGDEFAVLVAPATPQSALAAAHHYLGLLNQPFAVRGISMTLNATVGIALSPDHGETVGSLLQHAEVAMYWGKAQHNSLALYRAELDSHSLLRLALMSELKGAIESQQLSLYFQPKLNIASRTLLGVECLVRWIHPQHGFIAPDEFIPLAEQTGNICALTRWVIRTALAQTQSWHAAGLLLKTAVNISALDLLDPDFAAYVACQLKEHQVDPASLVIEITESAVMSDPALAMQQLEELRQLGVWLSIDDYGTGYSSMAQLKRLPVDELKIDKSFVSELPGNPDDEIIVRSTIELAHNMGLKVVAEGVETLAVLEQLDQLGCDIAQGYLLSKPLSPVAFADWLENCPWQLPRR